MGEVLAEHNVCGKRFRVMSTGLPSVDLEIFDGANWKRFRGATLSEAALATQLQAVQGNLAMARRTLEEIHDGLNPRQEEFADVLVDISNVRLLAAKAMGDIDETVKLRGEV